VKSIACGLLLAAISFLSCADGLQSLENFVKSASSGRADFVQVVSSPARDGHAARSKTSSGSFQFLRPNRFRFDYKKPFPQSIVADGQTLWLYDVDLNQVTARPQSVALGSTPAALIAAAPDLRALQAEFTLAAAPDSEGLRWLLATPRARDGQLNAIRLGFRQGDQGTELSVLDIQDNFGQRSVIRFANIEINPRLAEETFRFKPPKGADVIRP